METYLSASHFLHIRFHDQPGGRSLRCVRYCSSRVRILTRRVVTCGGYANRPGPRIPLDRCHAKLSLRLLGADVAQLRGFQHHASSKQGIPLQLYVLLLGVFSPTAKGGCGSGSGKGHRVVRIVGACFYRTVNHSRSANTSNLWVRSVYLLMYFLSSLDRVGGAAPKAPPP